MYIVNCMTKFTTARKPRATGLRQDRVQIKLTALTQTPYSRTQDTINLTESATVRMWSGRAFQVAGPACENARLPNFVRSRGRE